jgi:hypothetical protein
MGEARWRIPAIPGFSGTEVRSHQPSLRDSVRVGKPLLGVGGGSLRRLSKGVWYER